MTALYLSSLTLSHFRSHKRAEVVADARPVAIYGPNGAGKTNLLEAVSLFSPGRGMRRAAAGDMTRRPEALGWKVDGILHGVRQPHEISFQSQDGAARSVKIDGKSATQTMLGQVARVLWLLPSMDRLWIEGAEGRRRFLDRMTLSFFPGHGDAVLAYEKAMRDRNRLLKDHVQDASWFHALEVQMARAGVEIHANRQATLARIAAAQDGAATQFPAADLALIHADGDLPETEDSLQQALAASRPQDYHAGRSLVGPHRADLDASYAAKSTPARECSTGEQKALLISLILANARALAADIDMAPILLLDEVAAHLDPDRRAALFDEICELGAQAWMTGTERSLFDHLGPRAQYLEVTQADTRSDVRAA
ncbi:DNA replication/repair protein RecF [Mesobacterium sp. TK19101]|uniref:DNA replication and repair protein RecF n=1 Tax=Mesobacterium hydrothermale TaxID=3111907 RepID=A0ABU6HIW1_9RHOB|nr:DNA replication/repair protein RecF [Mesobacterium sp. TK19101]MEC3861846.1 DNA replication/repair protein RecF [Mesobacterium sp. TK19101]